jgi:Right handed beta helix region
VAYGSEAGSTAAHVSRRGFLGRVGGAVLALAGMRFLAHPARLLAADAVVSVVDYGAVGNGRRDDAEAFRAALAAVPEGGTVLCKPRARHLINSGVLDIPRDRVTLDLNGATLIGGSGAGTPEFPGELIHVDRRSGVRVTNGRIECRAPTQSGSPETIVLEVAQACRIDHLIVRPAPGGRFLWILSGSGHAIEDNSISYVGEGISAHGCSDVVIARNTIQRASRNAIAVVGFEHAEDALNAMRNSIEDNVILFYGRNAIEVYAFGAIGRCVANAIRRNRIASPSTGAGFAISEMGNDGVIEANVVENPIAFAAIEASAYGHRVSGNRITRTTANKSVGGIVVVHAAVPDAPQVGTVVSGNELRTLGKGITISGQGIPPPTIEGNLIVDPLLTGIDLPPGPGGTICRANQITCGRPPLGANRSAIRTVRDAEVSGNQIRYTLASKSSYLDTPLELIGNGVKVADNLADGGGRSDGRVVSRAGGGPWSGLVWLNNPHINGARLDPAGLSFSQYG